MNKKGKNNMIKVDEDKCEGCGICEAMCPDIFKIENGKSKVISQDYESCGCDIQNVIDSCPDGAISKD